LIVALGLAALVARAATNDSPRQRLLMDFGWKFHLGDDWGTAERLDKAGQSTGPARPDFDDTSWRSVNLPHDWAVELPYDEKAGPDNGYKPVGPGYVSNSVGWYRRAFPLPAEYRDKRLWLEFDGVFRDSRIFLNGYLIAHHEGGYGSMRFDITDVANSGGTNVLAVRVDASESEGSFYEGAGIYRHVWLVVTAPVAIAGDGTFVYSQFSNNVPRGPATLQIETQVRNSQSKPLHTDLQCLILDPDGKEAAGSTQSVAFDPLSLKTVFQSFQITSPVLWSPEKPRLYKMVTSVLVGGAVVDRTETEFGIRTIAFDPDKGFLLNGAPYVIKGVCLHQDHAGVGTALPDSLQVFRIARLKEMGANAIRTTYNQPTPELLEACDHLGMLVMDENRQFGSDSRNLGRLERLVCRDRNHPSVFIWCLAGEEIVERTDTAGRIAAAMQRLVHQLDPTRPCTAAMNSWSDGPADGISLGVDVQGFNYGVPHPVSPTPHGSLDRFHAANPKMPAIGTEVTGVSDTRGNYENTSQYPMTYNTNKPSDGSTAEEWWNFYVARPWSSGDFVSTGFDHRGPIPVLWPDVLSMSGILDSCGFPKDVFYYYQSCWSDNPVLHIMPHWNWPGMEGRDINVLCFANCDEIELFLNGQSLGRKPMPKNSNLQWTVKYAPGTLLARGYKGGREIATCQVETAGPPAAIHLSPDRPALRADGEDAVAVEVNILDSNGRPVPVAGNLVHFQVTGPGEIIGVGNGDPASHEPDVFRPLALIPSSLMQWQRHVFNGLAQVIVQSAKTPGKIQFTARSEGLSSATLEIPVQPPSPRPAVP
jgi:beta-galactosidase